MTFELNTFLQVMEGNWISQKTTYYLINNQICCNQFKYAIHLDQDLTYANTTNQLRSNQYNLLHYNNSIKQENTYSLNQTNQNNLGIIRRKNNNNLYNYQYSIYKDNCLKIEYRVKNIEYIEYINAINKKFMTSVAFLKKSNKYIAISFSSNIKIKEFDIM